MEHSPRPGATWDTRLVRVERVVVDEESAPQPNRAARRAAKRTQRKASR